MSETGEKGKGIGSERVEVNWREPGDTNTPSITSSPLLSFHQRNLTHFPTPVEHILLGRDVGVFRYRIVLSFVSDPSPEPNSNSLLKDLESLSFLSLNNFVDDMCRYRYE